MNPKRTSPYCDGSADPNDPTDTRSVAFDWDDLAKRMGEAEPEPNEYAELGERLRALIDWIIGPDAGQNPRRGSLQRIGTRLLIVADQIGRLNALKPADRQRFLRIVRRAKRKHIETGRPIGI